MIKKCSDFTVVVVTPLKKEFREMKNIRHYFLTAPELTNKDHSAFITRAK
jgi:hypothetical protein